MKRLRLVAILLLLAVSAHASRIGPGQRKIYSNVRYNKQTKELVGKELILVIFGDRVSATLNDFQGGLYPIQRVLKGTLRDGELHLRGKSETGKVFLYATISGPRVTGNFTFRPAGERPHNEALQLRLATRCVYPTCAGPTME